jgi:hypothetical protein
MMNALLNGCLAIFVGNIECNHNDEGEGHEQ